MRIAILVVGHENFGKSRPLVDLTGSKNSPYWKIDNKTFVLQRKSNGDLNYEFILQRKSNADIGYNFIDKIKKYISEEETCLLLAFCPDFDDLEKYAEEALNLLKK